MFTNKACANSFLRFKEFSDFITMYQDSLEIKLKCRPCSFIQILSKFYPDFIQSLTRLFRNSLYPDFIQVLFLSFEKIWIEFE
jgi:hypothetical protein